MTSEPLEAPTVTPPENDEWRAASVCVTLSQRAQQDFYADEHTKAGARAIERAKVICQACPVQRQCLDHALSHGEPFGVWGATGEEERKRLARGVHGTPERYRARRCRCEPCTDAWERRQVSSRDVDRVMALLLP